MSRTSQEIEGEALAWLVRVNDPEFDQWAQWESWLAQDPQHAACYWDLAEREAELTEGLPLERRESPEPGTSTRSATPASGAPLRDRGRGRWLGAIAAAVSLGLVGMWWLSTQGGSSTVATAPGERRTLTLSDGTLLHLDSDTVVELDRRDDRRASLERGRLLAEVIHDDRRPFRLTVGRTQLTDLGTAFDVTRLQSGVRVAVSEGVVEVRAPAGVETLRAGQALLATDEGLSRRSITPGLVGDWRRGRLTYQDESLAVVAEDLARGIGRPVSLDPALGARRFTGSLRPQGSPAEVREQIERLLEVRIVDRGREWRLEPHAGE